MCINVRFVDRLTVYAEMLNFGIATKRKHGLCISDSLASTRASYRLRYVRSRAGEVNKHKLSSVRSWPPRRLSNWIVHNNVFQIYIKYYNREQLWKIVLPSPSQCLFTTLYYVTHTLGGVCLLRVNYYSYVELRCKPLNRYSLSLPNLLLVPKREEAM